MYNFSNMDDYEFELLSKDIIEKELSIELRNYTKGRDGGIDIRGYFNNDLIIQVKHYVHSSYSSLKSSLIKEKEKIKKLKVKRYIIVTSFRLTPENENEIYDLFKEFMKSRGDIYDSCRLDSILSESRSVEIVRKHYKLWLVSSNILTIISNNSCNIDIKTFMYDFDTKSNLFVETKAYKESIKNLDEDNLILLYGEAGIGKTTLSKMILAYYGSKGYDLRYVSNKSIRDIKNILLDNDSNEIILIDDFLGQHYVDINLSVLEELKSLIIYISSKNNKKLILNSRTIILNEALRNNQEFENFLLDINLRRYLVTANEIRLLDKAKILYKHIYFNRLPLKYYNEIKKDKRYLKVIKHRNFNPRIIEYITRKNKVISIAPNKYFDFIIKMLENPKDIWKEEFNKFKKYDRIFINTLYSLTTEFVDEDIFKKCFYARLNNDENYDTTLNIFMDCLNRLLDSLVTKKDGLIKMLNPSINDYIYNYLSENDSEIESILKSAVYVEQLKIIQNINPKLTNKFIISSILTGEFLNLKVYYNNYNIEYYYLYYISEFNIMDRKLLKFIHINLSNMIPFGSDKEKNSDLVMRFFSNKDMFKYYKLYELMFCFRNLCKYYEYMNVNALKTFIPFHESIIKKNKDFILSEQEISLIDSLISWEIEIYIISILKERIEMIILSNISDFDESLFKKNIAFIKKIVKEHIELLMEKELDFIKNSNILCKNIWINNEIIFDEIDLYDKLSKMEDDLYDLDEPCVLEKDDDVLDEKEINELFNREYLFVD